MGMALLILLTVAAIGSINAAIFDPTTSGNSITGSVSTMTNAGVSWNVDVGQTTTTVTITIPSDGWFGVGFGSTGMVGAHAVVMNWSGLNQGAIEERDFTTTNSGSVSTISAWTVDSFTEDVASSTYTYVISRANTVAGLHTFDASAASLDFISARKVGSTSFTYHGGDNRIYGTLVSAPTSEPTVSPSDNPTRTGETPNPSMDPSVSPSNDPTAAPVAGNNPSKGNMVELNVLSFIVAIAAFLC